MSQEEQIKLQKVWADEIEVLERKLRLWSEHGAQGSPRFHRAVERKHLLESEMENSKRVQALEAGADAQQKAIEKVVSTEPIAATSQVVSPSAAQARQPKPVNAVPLPTWVELQNRSSISQKEAARFLMCHPRTIRRRAEDRELTRSRNGRIVCNEQLRNQIRKVHGEHVLR